MANYVDINVDMIAWAIVRAGHDLQNYFNANPNIAAWYSGDKKPTVKQLQSFSNKIHMPFGYFFASEPPEEEVPIPFFRTNDSAKTNISLNVYDTILSLQKRQEWLVEFLKEENNEKLSYVGKFNINTNYQII